MTTNSTVNSGSGGRDKHSGTSPQTLPGRLYFDPAIYETEKERIFYRTWQYVGHTSMLGDGSHYLVREIGDQSIIVLKDGDGNLRAFYNVCQHRAHRLLEGEGPLRAMITCPYHTWAYDHEGRLQSAKGTQGLRDFDKRDICLKRVRLETFGGFLFVNLDADALSLAELTPGLEEEFRAFAPW